LANGINFGIENKWVYFDREGGDSQYTTFEYRLTGEGKKHFGLAP